MMNFENSGDSRIEFRGGGGGTILKKNFWLKNIIADFAFWGGGHFLLQETLFQDKRKGRKFSNFLIFSKVSVVEVEAPAAGEARQLKGEARAGGFLRGAAEPPLGFRIF